MCFGGMQPNARRKKYPTDIRNLHLDQGLDKPQEEWQRDYFPVIPWIKESWETESKPEEKELQF